MSAIDVSCQSDLLTTNEKVFGLIYRITNTANGMCYVGQTVSHRKNRDKYRPFGIEGRFKDHVSEAINNTKKKQCSFLNNAIRKHGKDAFIVEMLEICTLDCLNDREQYHIGACNTLFPHGYNLTKGGKTPYVASHVDASLLREPMRRGGCTSRSETTRAKMSKRLRELADDAFRAERVKSALAQHHRAKVDRFTGCALDPAKFESYIRKKGSAVVVKVGEITASFGGKHDTLEEKIERAKEFLKEIYELNNATLSNCGKPVKPE